MSAQSKNTRKIKYAYEGGKMCAGDIQINLQKGLKYLEIEELTQCWRNSNNFIQEMHNSNRRKHNLPKNLAIVELTQFWRNNNNFIQ